MLRALKLQQLRRNYKIRLCCFLHLLFDSFFNEHKAKARHALYDFYITSKPVRPRNFQRIDTSSIKSFILYVNKMIFQIPRSLTSIAYKALKRALYILRSFLSFADTQKFNIEMKRRMGRDTVSRTASTIS